MPDAKPATKRLPLVRRGFEFSRLQEQLLALAYERLLPIIRPPACHRSQPAGCLLPSHDGGASLQEEEGGENR
jgi:hypothetical protein